MLEENHTVKTLKDLQAEGKVRFIGMSGILRFTLSHPGMSTTIVGTSNPVHLASNIGVAEKGPLPADLYEEAKKRLPLPETR
jgi:aryl-alcohol dehydrogenase-like predicted oxidoreductase